MKTVDKIQLVKTLVTELNGCRDQYYAGEKTALTDDEYDYKYRLLTLLEKQYPEMVLSNSPTQSVGQITTKGNLYKHIRPLLSLGNVFNDAELSEWVGNLPDPYKGVELAIDYKLDGLAMSLTYSFGKLVHAVTRGNGTEGEIVTHSVGSISTISHLITELDNIPLAEIHGEVLLPQKAFERLNSLGGREYANPRNAAAGLVRSSKTTADAGLTFIPYGGSDSTFIGFNVITHTELMSRLSKYFPDVKYLGTKIYDRGLIPQLDNRMIDGEVGIDGMVIKVNDYRLRAAIGKTSHEPKWAIAFKFMAMSAITALEDVLWQVGRTGRMTPVAILTPVQISGSTITRVTLHNYDMIRTLNLQTGIPVVVSKRGDVIPKVESRADLSAGTDIALPIACPCCGSKLEYDELFPNDEVGCVNANCTDRLISNLLYFVSRPVMNIDGVGYAVAEQLVKEAGIKRPMELLWCTEDTLSKAANSVVVGGKIFKEVQRSRTMTLDKFINGLCRPMIGKTVSKLIAKKFGTIENFMRYALSTSIADIEGIGPVISKMWKDIIFAEHGMIGSYIMGGLTILPVQQAATGSLTGKSFVITGSFEGVSRDQLKERIESVGGKVSGSVRKNTNYLVVGANAGSKVVKAAKLGVTCIELSELDKLII